jgi:hypothetical protein
MEFPINIDSDLEHAAKLPHSFLNHLLENGYQFEGVLCLKITGTFGSCHSSMTEFKPEEQGDAIDIGYDINRHLNLITGEYVHVEKVEPQIPYMIKIQGHRESFGKIVDLKEQLEVILTDIKVLNTGTVLMIQSPDSPELCTVQEIINHENEPLEWALTVDTDLKVDFMETLESIEHKKREEREQREQREQRELEERGFKGKGQKVGGGRADRTAWLDRLQSSQKPP